MLVATRAARHQVPPCSVQVSRIASLFARADVTALSWLHLALMDAFAAREVFLDGLRHDVFTSHSVLLCFMFGPTGLLSHWLTKCITQALRGSRLAAQV
eukprot:jgi/Astpho2/1238/e_gw1.00023.74.1_t